MKRLLALAVGDAHVASVRYRVLAYAPAMEAAGYVTRIRYPVTVAGRLGRLVDLMRDTLRPTRESVLFVHRKTYPPPFASALPRPRRAFVFDMDDALDLPPPGHPDGDVAAVRYRRNFVATVGSADLVLCGNAELAARVPHQRTAIVPTPIDTSRFTPGAVAPASGPTLGWVGHSDNLPYLAALGDPLRELTQRHPRLNLIVVADRPISIPGVAVEFRKWRLEDEITCFGGFTAGLMPLEDTPWARAKCAFKAIQYMALGIPAIASPIGMNREVIRDGVNGFLAADPAGWVRAVDAVLSDPSRAARIGAAGRTTVEQDYSLARMAPRVITLLDEAVRRRAPS